MYIPAFLFHTSTPAGHTLLSFPAEDHTVGVHGRVSVVWQAELEVLFVCHYLLSVISLFKMYTLYDTQIVIVQYSIYREN